MERLTYDNFPRSGTAFLYETLVSAFPECQILWGAHRIETIRTGENVITPVRDPKDSVPSWIDFRDVDDDRPVEDFLDWNIRFLRATIDHFDRVFVVLFDSLIRDPNNCMSLYAAKFDLPEPEPIEAKTLVDSVSKWAPRNVPRPKSPDRVRLDERTLESPLFVRARETYEEVLSLCKYQVHSGRATG